MEKTAGAIHRTIGVKLENIEHRNFIIKLYRHIVGADNLSKDKHQRNLQVLKQFPEMKKQACIHITNVLEALGIFQIDAVSMEKTASQLDAVQTLQLDTHVKTLEQAIVELREYRQRFNQRLTNVNRI